jgi:hypothetical protein
LSNSIFKIKNQSDFKYAIHEMKKYSNNRIFYREEFSLLSEYLIWLINGTKKTTIRYKKNANEVPFQKVLPLYETINKNKKREVGKIEIENIEIKRFSELNENDAVRDGFSTKKDLIKALKEIYRDIEEDSQVIIYSIHLKELY